MHLEVTASEDGFELNRCVSKLAHLIGAVGWKIGECGSGKSINLLQKLDVAGCRSCFLLLSFPLPEACQENCLLNLLHWVMDSWSSLCL